MEFENNNDKQVHFNQIKGTIKDISIGNSFGSITLEVGHEKKRFVNMVYKKEIHDDIYSNYLIGDKITAKFYISSYDKFGKWKTLAHLLSIEKNISFEA